MSQRTQRVRTVLVGAGLLTVGAKGAAPARGAFANFDDLTAGNAGATVVDGGITFSNAQRLGGSSPFAIDNVNGGFGNLANVSPPNVLGVGAAQTGEALSALSGFDFSVPGTLDSGASLTLITSNLNQTSMSIVLEGLLAGTVRGSATYPVPTTSFVSGTVSLTGGPFDSFAIVSGNSASVFADFDNVTVTSVVGVPEPTGTGLISILAAPLLFVRRRRARSRATWRDALAFNLSVHSLK